MISVELDWWATWLEVVLGGDIMLVILWPDSVGFFL